MTSTFRVEITEAAEHDLQAIFEHVWTRTSAEAAERLLDSLVEAIATLESLPDRGAVPAELAELGLREFRQLVVQTYRLIYRVLGKTVVVLVIADGRQDMQRLLERRLLEH
jgi:toxin ParE1/3/4